MHPNGVQNGGNMGPKWLPGGRGELLGLLKASWSGLGGLLECFWAAPGPNKCSVERLLAGPRGLREAEETGVSERSVGFRAISEVLFIL